MATLDNMFKAADILSDNVLKDTLSGIMEMSDDNLTDTNINIILGMISGAFTEELKAESIKEIYDDFETRQLTHAQARKEVVDLEDGFAALFDELKPSERKKKLLDGISDIILEIYNSALDKYHSFDIDLPIMLDKGARMPTYAHESDACADVYALEDTVVRAHTLSNKIRTGLHFGTPENWQIGVLPRSSIGSKTPLRLSNSRGVIDEDYRDELIILYDNISDSDYEIKAGDRIAQMFVMPTYRFRGVKMSTIDSIGNDRGGGLGSTGT